MIFLKKIGTSSSYFLSDESGRAVNFQGEPAYHPLFFTHEQIATLEVPLFPEEKLIEDSNPNLM